MSKLRLAALAAGLAACGNRAAPAATGEPVLPAEAVDVRCGHLSADGRYDGPLQALVDRIAALGARVRFAEDYPGVRALAARGPAAVRVEVDCPSTTYLFGDGVIGDVVLGSGGDRLRFEGAYVAPEGDGFVVHANPPRSLFDGMQVRRVRADVWLSSRRRWMVVDLDVELESRDGRVVLRGLALESRATRDRTAISGLRLIALDVAGTSRIDQGELLGAIAGENELVLDGIPAGVTHLHVRAEGWPAVGEGESTARTTLLEHWLPAVPYQDAFPRDVRIHHPADEAVAVGGAASAPQRGAGWTVIEDHGVGGFDYMVLSDVRSAEAPHSFDAAPGAHLTIVDTRNPSLCETALTQAAKALLPLGPLGNVVVRGFAVADRSATLGRQSARLALVAEREWASVCDQTRLDRESLALATHELAHTLFGADVHVGADEATMWWESLAEYVSSWALTPEEARQQRIDWFNAYASYADHDDVPMMMRLGRPRAEAAPASYRRGALLMTSLEDRIGRDAMTAALRRFVAERSGKAGSWPDVVAAVRAEAGDGEAGWLEAWLRTPGAPDLALVDVKVAAGRARGVVRQDGTFPVKVVLGFMRGDEILSREVVTVTGEPAGARVPFDLPVPDGASHLVIDPDYRLPLRFGEARSVELAP